MNEKAYEAVLRITPEEWRTIVLDLERYALSKSLRLRWRTQNARELPGGETVDSIVSRVIEKMFSGEREWNLAKYPDIRLFLRAVIDSDLNHLADSLDNRLMTAVPDLASADAADWQAGSAKRNPLAAWLGRSARSPDRILLDKEQAALERRALALLGDECSADAVLARILKAIEGGFDGPAEISTATGIPIEEVYNAAKRLDRKLETIRRHIATPSGG